MLECISTFSRFRGPQAFRIQAMLRRVGKRVVTHDVRHWQCYTLDGWGWFIRRGMVVRVDWAELSHAFREYGFRVPQCDRRMIGGAA